MKIQLKIQLTTPNRDNVNFWGKQILKKIKLVRLKNNPEKKLIIILGSRWTLFKKGYQEYFSFYLHVTDNGSITYFSFHLNVSHHIKATLFCYCRS